MIKIGCIADDFTGASDAASFLKKGGLTTVLCSGTPKNMPADDCQAVVVALKTRSVDKDIAVSESLDALNFLCGIGAEHIYFKYCSTFDSTREGNIGPVADKIMEALNVKFTLLCPSLPVNKRIVSSGELIVGGVPLADSHMKNHPLNPMWDSSIVNLMKPQSQFPCMVVNSNELADRNKLLEMTKQWSVQYGHFYIIPDYITDEDGEKIVQLFGNQKFLTGGSGLLEHLAHLFASNLTLNQTIGSGVPGRGIGLCGSCSMATREQISRYKNSGGKYIAVDPKMLLNGEQSIGAIWDAVSHEDGDVLVYSVGAEVPPVKTGDALVDSRNSEIIEQTMSSLGKLAYDGGYTRIIVGGGETSGAVMRALSLDSFYIGDSIAPGVPIMTPTAKSSMRIALKSGNFGECDFFEKAFRMTKSHDA